MNKCKIPNRQSTFVSHANAASDYELNYPEHRRGSGGDVPAESGRIIEENALVINREGGPLATNTTGSSHPGSPEHAADKSAARHQHLLRSSKCFASRERKIAKVRRVRSADALQKNRSEASTIDDCEARGKCFASRSRNKMQKCVGGSTAATQNLSQRAGGGQIAAEKSGSAWCKLRTRGIAEHRLGEVDATGLEAHPGHVVKRLKIVSMKIQNSTVSRVQLDEIVLFVYSKIQRVLITFCDEKADGSHKSLLAFPSPQKNSGQGFACRFELTQGPRPEPEQATRPRYRGRSQRAGTCRASSPTE